MPSVEPNPKPEPLADYPIVVTLPILWGDQDAMGHVNNVVPIRWFESSRVAYFDAMKEDGFTHDGGIGPILARVGCNYRRQLHYPDTVHIGASIIRLGKSSFTMAHAVFSEHYGAIAVQGESLIVVFDYAKQHSIEITDGLRSAMQRIEGRPIDR